MEQQRCEVCESFRPQRVLTGRELLEISFDQRAVVLCRGHAGIARNSGVSSIEALRTLYAESAGKRSYVSRRAKMPASLALAPRTSGRRAGD